MKRRPTYSTLAALTVATLTFAGCGTYTLDGRVIRGEASYAEIVATDSERLQQKGMPGVRVGAHLNPGGLNREFLGSTTTGPNGEFSLPIDRVGAGFLEYDVSVVAYKDGYLGAEQFFVLPPDEKRVLIILAPGDDPAPPSFKPRESLFDEADRYR